LIGFGVAILGCSTCANTCSLGPKACTRPSRRPGSGRSPRCRPACARPPRRLRSARAHRGSHASAPRRPRCRDWN
jgi:hypothetical protein